jgi:hypothetical protein
LLIIVIKNLNSEVEFNINLTSVSDKPILLKRENRCHFSNANNEKILAIIIRFLTRKEPRDTKDVKINLIKV